MRKKKEGLDGHLPRDKRERERAERMEWSARALCGGGRGGASGFITDDRVLVGIFLLFPWLCVGISGVEIGLLLVVLVLLSPPRAPRDLFTISRRCCGCHLKSGGGGAEKGSLAGRQAGRQATGSRPGARLELLIEILSARWEMDIGSGHSAGVVALVHQLAAATDEPRCASSTGRSC